MKLSEMSTDKAVDVLCEASLYIVNIVADEDLVTELKHKVDDIDTKTRAEILAFGVERVTAFLPIIFKKHRSDVFGILAVLNNTSIKDIASQNILTTMAQIKEVVQDKDFVDFFKSCVSEGKK